MSANNPANKLTSENYDPTSSLTRLLAKQGRYDEARRTLENVYNWFIEGFHTADLKDAKALLNE